MAATRRLAALLAADVAGYSRLMGADEEGTHERIKAHLAQLVDPKIKEHRGRIVKNTGDGFLAEFASVVDTVRCAVEVQRGMIDREPETPDEQRIRFRIGINLGDMIAAEAARPTNHPDTLDYILRGRAALNEGSRLRMLPKPPTFSSMHWRSIPNRSRRRVGWR